MTKEEWKVAEDQLNRPMQSVHLLCDGYKLTLRLERYKMKLIIAFYVNGEIKGAWLNDDCEERRRFCRPVKKSCWTAKHLALMKKASKRQLKRLGVDPNEHFIIHYPWWTSFKTLKSHLIKNNTSIELAPEA